MLFDTKGYRLFLRPGSVDFRKGSNSLAQLVVGDGPCLLQAPGPRELPLLQAFLQQPEPALSSKRQDLKESEKQLYQLAYYDSLTGLHSREYFIGSLQKSLERARKLEKRVGIIFIDFDSFKAINDTPGHMVGDLVLQVVAQRLAKQIGQEGTLARFGGDKFLVKIPDLDTEVPIHTITDSIMGTLKNRY